jgi:hypothetical protein
LSNPEHRRVTLDAGELSRFGRIARRKVTGGFRDFVHPRPPAQQPGMRKGLRLVNGAERHSSRGTDRAPPQPPAPGPRRPAGVILQDDRNFGGQLRKRQHLAREVEAVHMQDVGAELAQQASERLAGCGGCVAKRPKVIVHALAFQMLGMC